MLECKSYGANWKEGYIKDPCHEQSSEDEAVFFFYYHKWFSSFHKITENNILILDGQST